MTSTKIAGTFFLICTVVGIGRGQNISQGNTDTTLDVASDISVFPSGFDQRRQMLSTIFKTIDNKQVDAAIAQADKLVAEAILNKDTANLRDAYRLLSKAYHNKGDLKQRDKFDNLIQDLAIAYGYHFDDGIAYLDDFESYIYNYSIIYDELQLLEDREGKLSFEMVSSPLYQHNYTHNFTVESGNELNILREDGGGYAAPKTLFNQEAVYWVKLKMTGSQIENSKYLIHIGAHWGASWDYVDLYVQSKNKVTEHYKFGLALSPNEKDFKYNHNLFDLEFEKNEVKILYIRLDGTRKNNQLTWRPNHMSLSIQDSRTFFEFDGYYHIPDSLTHTHTYGQPRRLNHMLHAANFIEDPSGDYQLNDVVNNWDSLNPKYAYQLESQEKENTKYYWARLNIVTNAINGGSNSFMISEQWDDVEVYIPDGKGGYIKSITGSNLAYDEKTVPGLYNIFRIYTIPNDTLSVYLKLKSNKVFPFSTTAVNKFELFHFDEAELWYNHNKIYMPLYLMTGIILILLLYYLTLYIINKEKMHLYLVLMFLGMFIVWLNNSNLIPQFPPNRLALKFGFYFFLIALFRFAETILNIKEISRRIYILNRIVYFVLITTAIVYAGFLCTHYFFETIKDTVAEPAFLTLFDNYILVVFALLVVEAIYAHIKGVKYAKFFLIFHLFLICFSLVDTPLLNVNINQDKKELLKGLLIILSFLGIMLITAFRIKDLLKDQAEKEKAQASERAKHQFLANMSHEIRTPMNAIKGMTDILIRRNPNEDQKEYLTGIKQSSDSLLVIINDILDISKIEAGKVQLEKEPFSVNELVNNVHTIMQFKAEEKGLGLKKEMPAVELTVLGDATRLRQILLNLIGNAIKFTEKGLVTTTVKSEQSGEQLNLHFIVSDTGIGIDNDRMEKIFESFEQAYSDTTRKFGGTGLGLSISKKLVELHDGKIWVESEKGKGSQFHFIISYTKVSTTVEATHVSVDNADLSKQLKGIHILLVEDNHYNAIVAQEELEDAIEDVQIEVAANGLIAVEKLKSNTFDVILMDVQMPVMNGFDATKAIRKLEDEKANTPIIAMTANVLKEEVDLCYLAGMNDFIGKPFETDELLVKIQNLLKK